MTTLRGDQLRVFARPTGRMVAACLGAERVAYGQIGAIFASVTLAKRDVSDAAMAVLEVVPLHEACRSGARCDEVSKAFVRKLRSVFSGAKCRFGKRVVVEPSPTFSAGSKGFASGAKDWGP
jgi:hypothetical protein